MSDISPAPVFAIDRLIFVSRAALVEVVKFHLTSGSIVHVEDSSRPRANKLCYEVRPGEAFHLLDASGRRLGIFADVAAMIDHAEASTQ